MVADGVVEWKLGQTERGWKGKGIIWWDMNPRGMVIMATGQRNRYGLPRPLSLALITSHSVTASPFPLHMTSI